MQIVVDPIKKVLDLQFSCSVISSFSKRDTRLNVQSICQSPEHFENDLREWKENTRVQNIPRVAINQFMMAQTYI